MNRGDRAVAPIVGYVILFGLVGIASVSLLVAGSGFVADSQQQMEQERVEQSFTELSQRIETEAASPDMAQVAELDAGDHGTVTRENSATMTVSADNLNKDITVDIGTIEWTNDAGTTVAYQGGGVFRNTGAQTQVISSPSIRYDVESETLTMPVYNVTSANPLSSGTVQLEQQSVKPVNKVSNWKEHNVSIRIESEYYMGWKAYFEDQGGDTMVTDSGQLTGDKGFVEVELGFGSFEDAFADGVSYSDTCDNPGTDDCEDSYNDVSEGNAFPPMDTVVEQMIDSPKTAMDQNYDRVIEDGDTIKNVADEYILIDRNLDNEEIKVDLTGGNATLAVNGDIRNTDITVTKRSGDHTLQIYVSGGFYTDDANVCVDKCGNHKSGEGSVIQMFGTSEMGILFKQGSTPTFEGLIYAASDEDSWNYAGESIQQKCEGYQLCDMATADIYGGVVVKSIYFQSESHAVTYDEKIDTADVAFRQGLLPPRIAYLNVVEHRVSVENE